MVSVASATVFNLFSNSAAASCVISLASPRPRRTNKVQVRLAPSRKIGQGSGMASRFGEMRFIGQFFKILLYLALALAFCVIALVFIYRSVAPTSTLMLARWAEGKPYERVYVPLSQISPNLRLAVIASEDALFCQHHG